MINRHKRDKVDCQWEHLPRTRTFCSWSWCREIIDAGLFLLHPHRRRHALVRFGPTICTNMYTHAYFGIYLRPKIMKVGNCIDIIFAFQDRPVSHCCQLLRSVRTDRAHCMLYKRVGMCKCCGGVLEDSSPVLSQMGVLPMLVYGSSFWLHNVPPSCPGRVWSTAPKFSLAIECIYSFGDFIFLILMAEHPQKRT